MTENTKIEWADSTFNPWTGCTKVGPGCDHCYAEGWAKRSGNVQWGPHAERRRTTPANWRKPLQWERDHQAFHAQHGRRQRVFCASLADVFDNAVDPAWRAELFALIDRTPHLCWLLLTKRIGNVAAMVQVPGMQKCGLPPNVWLGATVVNQEEADRDIPKLLAVPARVRFLSIEPMLGPIDLGLQCENWSDDIIMDPETGAFECCKACDYTGIGNAIDWVICGGESGPGARPMHPDWARSLRDKCASAGVPFLFKQWGEWAEHDSHRAVRTVSMDTDIGQTLATRCEGFISRSGEFVRDMAYATTDDPYRGMVHVGKKVAGRLLDGVEHNGFPSPT